MNADTPKRRPWTLMVYMAGDNGKVFHTNAGPAPPDGGDDLDGL